MIKHFIAMFILFMGSASFASRLDSIQVVNQGGSTAILCKITGSNVHKVYTLHQPERIVIDLPNANTIVDANHLKSQSPLIRTIRIGHPTPAILRVVLDLNQPVLIQTSNWQPGATNQFGLKISVKANQPSFSAVQTVIVSPKTTLNLRQKPMYARHAPARSLRDVIVVIDPGHGGKDPGAIGARRSNEKHVVLSIALQLKRLIDRQPGMRAVLTRTGDYYVGLRDRMHIARKYNGDIFVAIHADAFGNHNSHGASVFALSQTGATSEAARWLAEKENYSELGGVNLSDLDDQNGVIRTVLIDLSQTATINASLQMGSQVLRGLNNITTLHSHKVEQARFMVLKSPDIPSILIETGFISNPREEMNLNSSAYQARLSQAIFSGIKAYFWDYPPHGTRIEAMSGINRRVVQNNRPSFFGGRVA